MPQARPLSPAARQAVLTALALLQGGRFDDAAELHARVAADFPEDPEVAYLETELAVAAGDIDRAVQAIERAAAAAPDSLPVRMRQADVLATARRRCDAIEAARLTQPLARGDGRILWALGRVHARCGDPLGARDLYREAAATVQDPALLNDLGVAEFFLGDADAAEAAFDRVLGDAPGFGPAAYMRSTARRQTDERNHVDALRDALEQADLDDANRAAYLYALAKELEDLGRDEDAFANLAEGARLKRGTLAYDAGSECDAMRAIATTFTADALDRIAPGDDGEGVIFIVGMPRTGTTLLEHLLARHAGVPSAGELPDFAEVLTSLTREQVSAAPGLLPVEAALEIDYADLGRRYMASARQAAAAGSHFVDKMPVNFMYCGLIARALPRAKILHLARDPMDTCYAVFKTLFGNAYFFSYDQDELARYFLAYRDLMDHWHRSMPGRILDIRYEDLVADSDRELRRVLDWCGLDWRSGDTDARPNHASMTASAMQVREPVHTGSIGKWRRHAEGLAPLRRTLEAAGLVPG